MSKNLNQEAAKAPDLVQAGVDETTQAAQYDPRAVGTVSTPKPSTPDISGKPKGL